MEGKQLVVAGGCFWCVEAQFEELKGVLDVESGYAGDFKGTVTYGDVCTGRTGAAEAVKITFDPKQVSEADLLRIFFVAHDPTTLNRQGPDSGTQYRSAIFYTSDEEKALGEKIIKEISAEKIYPNPIVTTLEPLKNYVRAEEYHQDYFKKYEAASEEERSHMNAGYCAFVVSPKVAKFREHYRDKLKKG
ncbi:MAG: peptide-methionine (S)-S-oxide reductase MsrA [Armatimonadetes bacterium]|nr:peptide-methionine (S)-S-oxide reductase MsrA [Armatimonadota bacterium]